MARPLYKNLTVQVLAAVVLGAAIGHFFPTAGVALKPVGEGFVNLVKMIVGPIIFLTIVHGIAGMGDLKKVGRVGGKALLYFEVVTTAAMAIGMLVANVIRPGEAIARPAPAAAATAIATTSAASQPSPQSSAHSAATVGITNKDDADAQKYAEQAKDQTLVKFILNIIPETFVGAFASKEILQVLLIAVLVGFAVAQLGDRAAPILIGVERLTEVMFRIVAMIMKIAPIGALGAMAFTVGGRGLSSLTSLFELMACVYLTMAIFIFLVLGPICRLAGISILKYLAFIKGEIMLVLGTSSSETALPRMMEKLELLGCGRNVVGLVIPAGYSFNLDGTSIYLSMATLFITQALGVHLSIGEQIGVLFVLLLTSKGAAAVTGGGYITLAATLAHVLPPEHVTIGLALVVGVDRFMSEARAITNLIGNGIATIVVSKWEGAFDQNQYDAAISGRALVAPAASGFPMEVEKDVGKP